MSTKKAYKNRIIDNDYKNKYDFSAYCTKEILQDGYKTVTMLSQCAHNRSEMFLKTALDSDNLL